MKHLTPDKLAENDTEESHQIALFAWSSSPEVRKLYPELIWLFHIPNGGWRSKIVANRLRAMGTKKGVPDICLPVKRGPWHCLWIELKRPKSATKAAGVLSPLQSTWIKHLLDQGHGALTCRGWDHARQMIIQYLEFKEE